MKPTPLTDEEIEQCCRGASNYYESSRAIEAAVNAKWEAMLTGEPVAWMNSKHDMTYLHGPYNSDDIPLYAAPQPAQPKTDTELINAGCRYQTDLMHPVQTAQQDNTELLRQALEALEEVNGLIKHQYTGTSAGMTDLQYALDHAYAVSELLKGVLHEQGN